MEVTNNSTSESVIDYANVKFGMELEKDQILEQLKELSFSQTLKLLDSIKKEDNDAFSEIIDLSAFSEAVVNEEELTEGKKDAIMWVYNTVKKAFSKGAAKAPDVIKKLDDAGAGKVTGWSLGGITVLSVADIALDITSWVGDLLSGETIKEIAALVWKHKLPAAAVIAALYGGKKLIDYVGDTISGEEETGNTTINNYYNEPVMAGEDTARLKKLAGIKEAPADVYSSETPDGDELQDATMHGLMDKIEDYYHAKTGDDMLDVQIGDDDVYIGNVHFSIYKNGEDLSYDLGDELEREDISIGRGPYQHKLSGDDLERSKTMTPDQIKVLAGIKEEKVVEGPDYHLQAQRETMNLNDWQIVELVASLYEKLDKQGGAEEPFTVNDFDKIDSNNESRESSALKEYDKITGPGGEKFMSRTPRSYSLWGERGKDLQELVDSYWDSLPDNMQDELRKFYDGDDNLNELGYGSSSTANPSRATINKQNSNVANRRYNITVQDQNRDSKVVNKAVAGSNIQPTGQGAARTGMENPDDMERANNAYQSDANAEQASINAQEIERLKQLAMGG